MLEVASRSEFNNQSEFKVKHENYDPMIELIVTERYETIKNLYDYDVEDFLLLFEMILVKNANRMISMQKQSREMKT